MRYQEPGWVLCAMNDPAGRRGIWYRVSPDGLEVCAGREGDDAYAKLQLDAETQHALVECLMVGAWMVESHYEEQSDA